MNHIAITTQKELDALPSGFKEYTVIQIQNTKETIYVNKAWENSSVVARGNSSVEAWENSSVVARGNSSVVARGNSSVVAWENSSVEAWENSSVEARGNSSVVARENVAVHLQSDYAIVTLFMFAVCWKLAEGKIKKMAETATIIIPKLLEGLEAWLESQGIKPTKKIIVYKKVSIEFKTQEGTPNEFSYPLGKTIKIKKWEPTKEECGENKLHACSRPYFCDEFRNNRGDRYIAIEVAQEDLYAWPNPSYPHKIAFRKGKVLHEVDKFGNKITKK